MRFARLGGVQPDNELNGITFHGVGRGTTVEYVQALMGKDDCLEWFGGTVDARYLLAVGSGDDTFDWNGRGSRRRRIASASTTPCARNSLR